MKPTGWLTTAPFLGFLAQRCCHVGRHESLQGRVRDHTGREVWLTSLAAEYPQGLCEELATHYAPHAATPIVRTDYVR